MASRRYVLLARLGAHGALRHNVHKVGQRRLVALGTDARRVRREHGRNLGVARRALLVGVHDDGEMRVGKDVEEVRDLVARLGRLRGVREHAGLVERERGGDAVDDGVVERARRARRAVLVVRAARLV